MTSLCQTPSRVTNTVGSVGVHTVSVAARRRRQAHTRYQNGYAASAIRLPGRYGIEYDRYMGMLSLVRLPSGALRVHAVPLLDRACACIVYSLLILSLYLIRYYNRYRNYNIYTRKRLARLLIYTYCRIFLPTIYTQTYTRRNENRDRVIYTCSVHDSRERSRKRDDTVTLTALCLWCCCTAAACWSRFTFVCSCTRAKHDLVS